MSGEQDTIPRQGAGLGATSSLGSGLPWAHSQAPGDGAGLTCAPSSQTTRCRISRVGLAALVLLLLGILLCQARTTAKEPGDVTELSMGALQRPEHRSPDASF